MVHIHAGLGNNQLRLLIVDVNHTGLGSIQATAAHAHATAETTATTAAHSLVVGVVGVEHTHHTVVVAHIHTEQTARIALLSTVAQIGIYHRTAVHTGTDTEVEHGLLVTIVDTRDTGQVALLIIGADLLDDAGGEVLQSRIGITEVLTIDLDLRHLLTVDGDITVLVDLGTRHTLHQFLNDGALGHAIGVGIEDQGVALRLHLGEVGRHGGTLQHDGVGLHLDRTCSYVLTLDLDGLGVGLEAHERDAQGEAAVARHLDGECTVCVCYCIGYDFLSA